MATPRLKTSWQLQAVVGEPTATVRVRNLQYTICGPSDAWGGQVAPQPSLVSAEVVLAQPFGSSSATDAVAADTVHYGLLSKAILATLGRLESSSSSSGAEASIGSLHGVLASIWADLTGLDFAGASADLEGRAAFLSLGVVRRLTVSIELPKASLLGSGVALSASAAFLDGASGTQVSAWGLTLELRGLRVPTLIGVNDNERQAKQVVVANIGVERYRNTADAYTLLEEVVVDAMMQSSFETLEALATYLASHITKHLVSRSGESGWRLNIGLEKPTAVPLADAACVELGIDTDSITPAS